MGQENGRVRLAVHLIVGLTMALIAIVAGGGAVAAQPSAVAFPPQRPTKVLVLGDSVLASTVGLYASRLPGRSVTVDAVVSRTTSASADQLRRLGSDWDVVVVLLGYNDGGSADVFQPAARRILDQLAAVPRVAWLSLHEVRPGYREVNLFIAGQAANRPNLRTADWNDINVRHPEVLAADGIHPRGAGPGLLADLVAAQVQQAEHDRAAATAPSARPAAVPPTPVPPTPVPPTPEPSTTTAAAADVPPTPVPPTPVPPTPEPSTTTAAAAEAGRLRADEEAKQDADRRAQALLDLAAAADRRAQVLRDLAAAADRRAQVLRDLAAAADKARADAEAALQARANAEADMALAIQRQQVVEDARTVARIDARAAQVRRARRQRTEGTTAPVATLRAAEVRRSPHDGPAIPRAPLAGLALGALAVTCWSARRRGAG